MIVDDWPIEWRASVSAEEVPDVVAGPPPNSSVDQAQVKEREQES